MLAFRTICLRRAASAALAVILLGLQSGVEPVHVCPVHDAIEGSIEYAGQQSHGEHSAHGAATTTQGDESSHCCTCLGSCLTATPALATRSTAINWLAFEISAASALVREDARLHPLPRLLPFATAPPLS